MTDRKQSIYNILSMLLYFSLYHQNACLVAPLVQLMLQLNAYIGYTRVQRRQVILSHNFHLLKRQHNYTKKESENLTNQQHKTLQLDLVQSAR